VRATKNRFGPADEVGCFEMSESGIVEVPDPSGLFTSRHDEPVPGTCITVTMEGRRPLLAELQALVAPSALQAPRRTRHGVDPGRVAMVLAVLERRAGLKLFNRDVYVSTVGGAKVSDPSADLAAAIAVTSAATNEQVTVGTDAAARYVAIGEIGLAGELRRVPGTERRLAEAARLGFTDAIIPAQSRKAADRMPKLLNGIRVHTVSTIGQALRVLDLVRRPGGSRPSRAEAAAEATQF